MSSVGTDVAKAIAKEFDDYYRDYFWNEQNDEPDTKRMKFTPLEPGCAKLDADEAVDIAIAANDYFCYNCIDDIFAEDVSRTAFVRKIHTMAKIAKAKHGDKFDSKAIADAFEALQWSR